jgi:hypothetical protein
MSQNVDEVVDNIAAAIKCLSSSIAGGAVNIRSLHLKAQDTPSLPIYISAGTVVYSYINTMQCTATGTSY